MKALQAEISDEMYHKALNLVHEGWFRNEKEIFQEALQRFLLSHEMTMMERFIREDIEWGLHGDD